MANILFGGSHESETDQCTITVYPNTNQEIYIAISDERDIVPSHLCLDIPTAIQFSKQLRKSIAHIKQKQGDE